MGLVMEYTQVMGCLGRGDGREESRRLAGLSGEGASGLQRAEEKVQKENCYPEPQVSCTGESGLC